MKDIVEVKRKTVESAIKRMMEDANVPMRQHLQVLKTLDQRIKAHDGDTKQAKQLVLRFLKHLKSSKDERDRHASQLGSYDAEVRRLHTLPHIKGDKGEKGEKGEPGIAPTLEEIVSEVLRRLPIPKDGMEGRPGRDAEINYGTIIDTVVDHIRRTKAIDISHIRNAETFMWNSKRYKVAELMHGGGSSSGGFTQLTATGTVDGSNTAFTFTQKPTYIVSDGTWYIENAGWTWNASTLTATMSVAPQTGIFAFV